MVCGVFANIFFSVCDYFFLYQWSQGMIENIIKMIGMTMFDSQDCGCGGRGEWNGNLHLKRSKFHETTKKSAVSPNGEKKAQQEVVGISGGFKYLNGSWMATLPKTNMAT